MAAAAGRSLERAGEALARNAARLSDLSPLGILSRGYAVCYAQDGRRVIRSAAELAVGDRLKVRLYEGAAACLVESVDTKGTSHA
jgi:exodeoxyribonuclease VII large subunit